MSDFRESGVGFRDLMAAEQQGVTEVAEHLGMRMLRELPVVAEITRAQATYDERVRARVCTPPAEALGDARGAQVVGFGQYMGEAGFPGATRVSPAVEEQKPAAPAQPARPSYRDALKTDGVSQVSRASAAWAAVTGRVKPPVDTTPTYGYAYPIGTTDVEPHPVDGAPVGSSWTSSHPTPDLITVIARRGESGQFDTVEVGVMPSTINAKGEIVPKADAQPLPLHPLAEAGTDFRFGTHHRVIGLDHLEEVAMPDEVRALLPVNPRGALFADANGALEEVLIETAKPALALKQAAAVTIATVAPAVARQPFQGEGTRGNGQVGGADLLVEIAAGADPAATVNGHIPAPRGESDTVAAQQ